MEKQILKLQHISKRFGAVQALKDVTFSVKQGEIHTLLGENGAGKSTIIKMLSGEYQPDEGKIVIDGKAMESLDANESRRLGISVVHQELTIFDNMTVYENIFPYSTFQGKKVRVIQKKEAIRRTKELMSRFGLSIDPMVKMNTLRLSSQQMVEILRALSENAKIVLLDEPTSGLNTQETDVLMKILRKLRDEGVTIIYISHRISEIMQISDRISIMRDGTYVDTVDNDGNLTENLLISKMVGRDFSADIYRKKVSELPDTAEVIYEVKNFTADKMVKDVSFSVRKGEIFGVFGLEGSGNGELSQMLFGLHTKKAGEIYFHGKKVKDLSPTNLIQQGMIYLNNNRKDAGLFFDMSIADNIAAPVLDKLCPNHILDTKKISEYTEKFVQSFHIVLGSVKNKPGSLSGGNQQKVMLSICLGTDPELIIVNEPTRGIDINAKMEILKFLEELSKEGVTIICFSSDLPELITLSDRILVMSNSKVSGILQAGEIDEESVMKLAALG
ncbi:MULTISPECIES: sugar ABC transporter ATP-binding protein [Mediterraneibacter]|uniref:sugar ABC transporter ATP-binding protein n=1 Tax=Mediterraneibacter TaxID=2316020 RepID=UPI00073F36CA|nr:sugar ABC transporter ATP-binding protein [Mediterraneibacter massiliensis]RGT75154.1 sugar ABC transporter ATP-binding protein [Ruminococcus sp. AF18-22]